MIEGLEAELGGEFCDNYLYFALLAGNLARDKFAPGSAHRHRVFIIINLSRDLRLSVTLRANLQVFSFEREARVLFDWDYSLDNR
jgi:hypothetical protein